MSGALVELAATGRQEGGLLDEEQKVFDPDWHRTANFSRVPYEVPMEGNPDFGQRAVVTVPRVGDLVHRTYVSLVLPELNGGGERQVAWAKHPGHSLLRLVQVEIGGHRVAEHTGEWLALWTDLTDDGRPKMSMIGGSGLELDQLKDAHEETRIWVPLKFWWCEQLCNAMPMVALAYHDVKLHFEFRDWDGMVRTSDGTAIPPLRLGPACVVFDCVYLPGPERRSLVENPHRQLITQVQRQTAHVVGETSLPLNFYRSVRQLVWFMRLDENTRARRHLHFNSATDDDQPSRHLLAEARLLVNGLERCPWLPASYFFLVQNYQHAENYSDLFLYMFSFALTPASHEPTGALNFSLVDDVTLQVRPDPRYVNPDSPAQLVVYALTDNELHVQQGMGALKYST